ncbi:hypothetical protein AVEN_110319-1 [Araneus ventricosus]|uniref:Uncharacterized protein n=1 Tax=Araneus ventricosus TaxID=182803 RepID=A0A4Y2LP19_ARAVE|nr:hypothetical protein AVEN_110319-1 [Araneus ventricosus]
MADVWRGLHDLAPAWREMYRNFVFTSSLNGKSIGTGVLWSERSKIEHFNFHHSTLFGRGRCRPVNAEIVWGVGKRGRRDLVSNLLCSPMGSERRQWTDLRGAKWSSKWTAWKWSGLE